MHYFYHWTFCTFRTVIVTIVRCNKIVGLRPFLDYIYHWTTCTFRTFIVSIVSL